uniref:Olfactory receptor n=1 Tax=Glyphodes pyloalis TaxID=1242752 RepID=A0A6M3GVL5_GLYPY|nr:olfactory receptor [Glyphodes pyloalis]
MNRENFTFEKVFYITAIAMHINRSHPFITRNLFWIFQFLIVLTLSATSFWFLFNSVVFYDIPAKRYTEASKNGTMCIVALTITAKYAFLLYFQAHLKSLILIVDKDYQLAIDLEIEERDIVIKYAKRGTTVSKFWIVCATLTSALFPLKAFFAMFCTYLDGKLEYIPMFDMRYPNRIDVLKEVPAMFCFLFFLCILFDVYATTMYIGFDPLVPIFLLHICGQLDILSHRMLKLFSEDSNSLEINEKLKCINMKLQDLYRLVDIL